MTPHARECRSEQVIIKLDCLLSKSAFKNEQGAIPIVVDRDLRRVIGDLARDYLAGVPRDYAEATR